MPNRLKNIRVDFISLVERPANLEKLILKGGLMKEINLLKFIEEKRVAYGIVYAPEQVDAQGDFADKFEIEKAAYAFMKEKKIDNVDLNHSFTRIDGCYVCESWIVKEGDPYFSDKVGAWAVGIKVEDDNVWQLLKEGKITGISMAGQADKEPVEKDFIKAILDGVKNIFKENKKQEETNNMNEELVKGIVKEGLEDIKKSFEQALIEIKTMQEQITKRLEKLENERASDPNPKITKSYIDEIL